MEDQSFVLQIFRGGGGEGGGHLIGHFVSKICTLQCLIMTFLCEDCLMQGDMIALDLWFSGLIACILLLTCIFFFSVAVSVHLKGCPLSFHRCFVNICVLWFLFSSFVFIDCCFCWQDGLTPLHCAARSGHEAVVDLLLEKEAPHSSKTKVSDMFPFGKWYVSPHANMAPACTTPWTGNQWPVRFAWGTE